MLSWYRPLGPSGTTAPTAAASCWSGPGPHWRDELLAELSVPHPDLAAQATRIEITRYGHAMAIPVPGLLAPAWRAGQRAHRGAAGWPSRTRDWSGYSIFEEAFTRGHLAV